MNSSSSALSNILSGLSSLFGSTGNSSNLFGVPIDTLRSAGQSSTSDAQKLSLQNQFADQAAQDSLSTNLRARQGAANIDGKAYQEKVATDSNAALTNSLNTATVQDRHGYAGGSVAGYSDGVYDYTPQIGGSPYMPTVTMQQHLNPQVGMMQEQNILRQQDANSQFGRDLASADNNRYNQSLLSVQQGQQQSNLNAQQYASNQKIAQIDAQSRLGAAAIGAQGSVLGSLFGSVSGGAINGRYW